MIQVSNEFKKAIKQPERRIKGYVEVLYDLPSVEITTTTSGIGTTSIISNINEITDGHRVENLYGSLDYLPLDGSYLTVTTGSKNSGFISSNLFEDMTTPTFTLSFSSTAIKGITMYFRTNIPTDLTINYSDGTSTTIQENEKEIIQVIFDSPKTLTGLDIVINDMEYQDRKIYLMEIDLGITQVYKDQDLIEFTVDEEVNKLVEEVPINETNITLNNMSDLFNPLNPKGIVPYLSENTLIKPYIGVLTETQGVEYVKMGEFYFDSHTNNSDATTTLVGKNIIKQLEGEILKDDNETDIFFPIINETRLRGFLNNYNHNFTTLNIIRNSPVLYFKDNNLLKMLKDISFYQDDLFYSNRDSQIIMDKQNNNMVDSITKSELINDVEYKKIDKINTIKLIKPNLTSNIESSQKDILKETIILKQTSEVVLLQSKGADLTTSTISQTGGSSASIISQGSFMVFAKLQGSVGDAINVTLSSNLSSNESQIELELTNRGEQKEVSLEFNSPVNVSATGGNGYIENSDILSRTPSYEMRFDYNGDPSLEAGDYINVETPYGYKPLFIQKNRFKFDGGLEGSIEGVE